MLVKLLDGLEVMVTGFFAVITHIDIVFAHEIVIYGHCRVNHPDGLLEMDVSQLAVAWPVKLVIAVVGPVGIDDAVGGVVLEAGLLVETVCGERLHQRGSFAIEPSDGQQFGFLDGEIGHVGYMGYLCSQCQPLVYIDHGRVKLVDVILISEFFDFFKSDEGSAAGVAEALEQFNPFELVGFDGSAGSQYAVQLFEESRSGVGFGSEGANGTYDCDEESSHRVFR